MVDIVYLYLGRHSIHYDDDEEKKTPRTKENVKDILQSFFCPPPPPSPEGFFPFFCSFYLWTVVEVGTKGDGKYWNNRISLPNYGGCDVIAIRLFSSTYLVGFSGLKARVAVRQVIKPLWDPTWKSGFDFSYAMACWGNRGIASSKIVGGRKRELPEICLSRGKNKRQ